MIKIGIIKESRSDDKRTPLTPKNVKDLLTSFSNIDLIVEPSTNRCFTDQEYKNNGAIISKNLDVCDLILGVKEIDPKNLIPNKKYMFFSHTSKIQSDNSAAAQGTPGMDKKLLLKEIQNKKITLIDYENIRDNLSRRYLGFGRFAGIVGCYNTLNLYLETLGEKPMPRAYELNSYDKLKENIVKRDFINAKILLTGDGRVAKGSLELLNYTNIVKKNKDKYLQDHNSSMYCNLTTAEYVEEKTGNTFSLSHFIKYPNMYYSILEKYMTNTNILISAHYWDPKSPKMFEKKDINKFKNLKVIGDITCDVNGSIPTTYRSSTIQKPYYFLNYENLEEIDGNNNSLAVMAVDNLPSELPKDSSQEFGNGIVNEVLPFIIKEDDGRIKKATIIEKGEFLPNYIYVKEYMNN